jgi:cell shape-determining protein MreD
VNVAGLVWFYLIGLRIVTRILTQASHLTILPSWKFVNVSGWVIYDATFVIITTRIARGALIDIGSCILSHSLGNHRYTYERTNVYPQFSH